MNDVRSRDRRMTDVFVTGVAEYLLRGQAPLVSCWLGKLTRTMHSPHGASQVNLIMGSLGKGGCRIEKRYTLFESLKVCNLLNSNPYNSISFVP